MYIARSERPYLAAFAGALLLLIGGAVMFAVSYRSGADAGRWVDHTRVIIAEIDSAHVDLNVAVSAAWAGPSGQAADALATYEAAMARVAARVARIGVLTADNAEQQRRSAAVGALVQQARARPMTVDSAAHVAAAAPLLESIRSTLRQMTTAERVLLTHRIDSTRSAARRQLILMLALIGLSLATTTVLFMALRRDLATRRRTARALRESERRLLGIIDAAPNAVVTLDHDGLITGWNPRAQELFGWAHGEVVGREFAQSLVAEPGRLAARMGAVVRRARKRGVAETRQRLRMRHRDGRDFPVALTLNGSAEADTVRMTAFLDDLSVYEQAQQALSRARDEAVAASGLKSEFLAHISHELRTPLNGIIGMAGLLRDTRLDAEQSEFADTIRRSGEHLLSIINDLLDLSKIEAGKLVLERADFDLELATRDVTDLLLPAAREKGTELVLAIAPDVPRMVRGDVGRVRQILLNLVGNAVKFTDGGHVLLRITTVQRSNEGARLHFAVSDTGIGIPADQQGRLFQSFVQAEASTSRRFGGTGLGLALSRQLVERMGGSIGFESISGSGSTFWFEVPLEIVRHAPDRRLPDLSDAHVLVVEDNEAARASLSELLSSWRMRHDAVPSGAEALRALAAARTGDEHYGFVLLDGTLPDVSTPELAREIRAQSSHATTRLLLLSIGGGRTASGLNSDSPFDAVVNKPIRPSELLDRMATAHGGHEPATTGSERRAAEQLSFAGVRVLLAEDNQVNQKVAGRMLERLGVRVDIAANGREAIAMARRLPYDIILMDCQMPEVDGFEATAEIRALESAEARPRVPIVALTAHAMAGDRERCIAAGMDDYLTKPVRQEALGGTLARFASPGNQAPEPIAAETAENDARPVVDEEHTRAIVDGDGELLASVLEIFEDSSRGYLDAITEAIRERDAEKLARAAHALRGSAANFRARRACDLASELELNAGTMPFDEAAGVAQRLDAAVRDTVTAVRELSRTMNGTGGPD